MEGKISPSITTSTRNIFRLQSGITAFHTKSKYLLFLIGCVIYGIFAGGMPGNGPLVYSEDFQKDLPSAMGIASIGRALAALSMGPVSSMSLLMLIYDFKRFLQL